MTEAEMRKTWCPHTRTVALWPDGPTAPRNRLVTVKGDTATIDAQSLVGCNCLGSACSQWRWTHKGLARVATGDPMRPEPTEGYCGLAGKP
jgi:hypothetical protein